MTPQFTPQPTQQVLAGRKTSIGGIISLILGGITMFSQIWGAAHGAPLDAQTLTIGGGFMATGVTGLLAADSKQPPPPSLPIAQ